MTLNGRPVTATSFQDAFEKSIFEAVCKNITDKVKNIGPTVDGQKLEVELIGSGLDKLSVSLSGPAELIEQAKKALGATSS